MNNKISEMFEGENSSLRKSFNEACMRGNNKQWQEELQKLSAENYHFIERVLNKFKNKEIGYSEAISCITEKYEQKLQSLLSQREAEIRKETIEAVLPERHIELESVDEQSKLMSIGFNYCLDKINENLYETKKKNYLRFFEISEGEIVYCEMCGKEATDLHHIEYRSQCGGDEVTNIIALCRECHSMAHNLGGLNSIKLSKKCLQEKHNQRIQAFQNMKSKKRLFNT